MGLLDHIKQAERYSLRVPGNGISTVGVNEIIRALNRVGVRSLDHGSIDAKDWQWDYRVGGKGEYVGVISKRIQKWCYQKHQIKLDEKTASKIGNLGNQHCDKATTYYFDWTKKFDWKKGDFGDEGSCFFPDDAGRPGQHWKAVHALEDNGAWGMRFYKDDTYTKGIGRVWVLDLEKYALCLNGYWTAEGCTSGNHGADQTLRLARVLAQWLDHLYYHRVKVSCSTNAMYLNGDASGNRCGYAVGHQDDVASLFEVNLKWADPKTNTCSECSGRFSDLEVVKLEGVLLCHDCISKKYDNCVRCGGNYKKGICKPIENGELYCQACMKNHVTTCKLCSKLFNRRTMYDTEGGHYCRDCGPKVLACCTDCGGKYLKETIVEVRGHRLCERCLSNTTMKCSHCHELHLIPRHYIARHGEGGAVEYCGNDGIWGESTLNAAAFSGRTGAGPDEFLVPVISGEDNCKSCGKSVFSVEKQLTLNMPTLPEEIYWRNPPHTTNTFNYGAIARIVEAMRVPVEQLIAGDDGPQL